MHRTINNSVQETLEGQSNQDVNNVTEAPCSVNRSQWDGFRDTRPVFCCGMWTRENGLADWLGWTSATALQHRLEVQNKCIICRRERPLETRERIRGTRVKGFVRDVSGRRWWKGEYSRRACSIAVAPHSPTAHHPGYGDTERFKVVRRLARQF